MEKNAKKEILFYYESMQNPNGDPGFENQPRLMPDETILVTDVRIKRTIRDYAKDKLGHTLFVDFGEKTGKAVAADDRAEEILGKLSGDIGKGLLEKTFDAPLFGGLVTIRKKSASKGDSVKITGPVQFGIGRSVNPVNIINPTISGRFMGDEKKGAHSTFGRFYSVEYALLKIQGAVNPMNLGTYLGDKNCYKAFSQAEEQLFECLWSGTNNLITRSKYPQRSIFYLEVEYDGTVYNDLGLLVEENEQLKNRAEKTTKLGKKPFSFDRLVDALAARKKNVRNVRIAACPELRQDAAGLEKELKKSGLRVEVIEC